MRIRPFFFREGYHCNKRNGFSTVQFSGGLGSPNLEQSQRGHDIVMQTKAAYSTRQCQSQPLRKSKFTWEVLGNLKDSQSQIWGHVQRPHLVPFGKKHQVVKQMAGIEVHNLRLIGKLSDGDQNADIQGCRPIKWTRQERTLQGHELSVCCRELCHSDILCQYWQCPSLVCGLSRVHVYWICKSVEKHPKVWQRWLSNRRSSVRRRFGSTIFPTVKAAVSTEFRQVQHCAIPSHPRGWS